MVYGYIVEKISTISQKYRNEQFDLNYLLRLIYSDWFVFRNVCIYWKCTLINTDKVNLNQLLTEIKFESEKLSNGIRRDEYLSLHANLYI